MVEHESGGSLGRTLCPLRGRDRLVIELQERAKSFIGHSDTFVAFKTGRLQERAKHFIGYSDKFVAFKTGRKRVSTKKPAVKQMGVADMMGVVQVCGEIFESTAGKSRGTGGRDIGTQVCLIRRLLLLSCIVPGAANIVKVTLKLLPHLS